MTERELKAAAVGIITYVHIMQTGEPPKMEDGTFVMETAAFLDNNAFDTTLGICTYANLDMVELLHIEE